MNNIKKILLSLFITLFVSNFIFSFQEAISGKDIEGDNTIFWLKNNYLKLNIVTHNNKIIEEIIEPLEGWYPEDLPLPEVIKTDADFNIEIQWTGWLAPNKIHNADNPVNFTKKDFIIEYVDAYDFSNDDEELVFTMKGINNPFEITITYHLIPSTYFVKRQIGIKDKNNSNHFLQWIWTNSINISGEFTVQKEGGFGEPIAIETNDTGLFLGMEYPTGVNKIEKNSNEIKIITGQEFGIKITNEWIKTEWSVFGITPKKYLKLWFKYYLDILKTPPTNPYLLYNTWYDLRAPELVKGEKFILNEKNLLSKIEEFKNKFILPYDIKLNAFVIDDGWDIYKSDWKIRDKEFQNGFKIIKDSLKKINADLGIWFGLSGGYSNRDIRINWMKENDYEVVGNQLCIAGKKYKDLLKQRIKEMVVDEGINYFKWDGIQFSCSEENHHHPVGIYSRRAIMQSIIELCQTARQHNPNIFLNITSGTWLSPWWIKYADAIWMQGEDFDWADIPSISKRDAAITYRDSILYQDYIKNNSWFPISYLMTHGIIKGNLEKLGSENESIEDFANDVILYFSRGISMWELYISPDLLSNKELEIIAKTIKWANSRYPILRNTEMIGEDPDKAKPYGYVHFDRFRGIIAVRNPNFENQTIEIKLSPSFGLDSNASSLVLMKIYPYKHISPYLYNSNDIIQINLQGYETAIYELFPLEEAKEPLISGVPFDIVLSSENIYKIKIRSSESELKLLNPDIISEIKYNDEILNLNQLNEVNLKHNKITHIASIKSKKNYININLNITGSPESLTLIILLTSNESNIIKKIIDNAKIKINNKQTRPEFETKENSKWLTFKIQISPSISSYNINIDLPKKEKYNINASAWLIYYVKQPTAEITFTLRNKIKYPIWLPVLQLPIELEKKIEFLGETSI